MKRRVAVKTVIPFQQSWNLMDTTDLGSTFANLLVMPVDSHHVEYLEDLFTGSGGYIYIYQIKGGFLGVQLPAMNLQNLYDSLLVL